jgi:hypothetical protein
MIIVNVNSIYAILCPLWFSQFGISLVYNLFLVRCRTVTVPQLKEIENYRAKDGRPCISNYKLCKGRGKSWELKIIDTHTSIGSMRHTVCLCDLRRHALRMYERGEKGPLLSSWHRLPRTGRG